MTPQPPPPPSSDAPFSPGARFPFVFPSAGEGWGDFAVEGGLLHRVLAFLVGVAQATLIHERVIDEAVSVAYRDVLRDPSVEGAARLLEALVVGRKVRAADLLGVVPPESSRSVSLTAELRELLGAALGEARGDGSARPPGEDRVPALELLADFLAASFDGELRGEEAGKGPRTLAAAARPGPEPTEGLGAVLVRRDSSRQPLYPFVLWREGESPLVLWSFAGGSLKYRPLDGGAAFAQPARFMPDFFMDFLLKMGAYEEVRDWLKSMTAEERAALNRRNILYAGFCHYGLAYLRQGEHAQAAVELEKATKIRPDLVLAHLHLAQAAMSLKQFDRAVDILKKHAVLYNRSDRLFELIGDCYRQKKDSATALKMYEKAGELNSFNRQVQRKRELLHEEMKRTRDGDSKGQGAPPAVVLEDYLVDMTLEAELGTYHGTVGREVEMRQLIEILACRDKKNPLLLGEPGVGKTALVEDFVLRLVQGKLPDRFRGKRVWLMSVATLLAGAKFRGQFEERVLELIKALRDQDCIVFIDNIHLIVSSGLTRGGALDAANLLKPYLLRGELQIIGATTHEEHRQNLERDTQLARALQPLVLEEPTVDEAIAMVCHVRSRYETHHRVLIPEDVVRATLPVIERCVRDRALPDKALDVLDRAAAVASLARSVGGGGEADVPELTREDVLAVLSEMTRIPVARLHEDARRRHARMEEVLSQRVVGQEDAVGRVSRVLRAARLNLVLDQRRPKGIFLFVGPTGVGKTELARAMAELLFGTDERLVRIDMSEYMERINQSRLIGTAPGYVGYNDQNQLTDEVRKQPHSLVLLDEIEKADTSMLNLFLQVFDAGRLTDGRGRTVHFDSTTICMTSNVGTHLFSRAALGFEEGKGERPSVADSELLREVKRAFTPEFLNRIDEIICFRPLAEEHVLEITRHKLARFEQDLGVEGKRLEVTDEAAVLIASHGHSPEHGARNLERTIRRLLLEPLAARAVRDDWEAASGVRVTADAGELVFELDPPDEAADEVSEPAATDLPLEDEAREPRD